MSAWAEAVWVKSFIDTVKTTVDNINTILSTININVNDIKSTVATIDTKTNTISDIYTATVATGQAISNNTYGLSAIVNNSEYGLKTIADLAVKKNVVLATNIGTAAAPIPTGISNSDVVNGALFFIES